VTLRNPVSRVERSSFVRVVLSYGIMATQQAQHTLTMQPVMWTHDSEVIRPTDPAFRYKVFNEHGAEVAFITNLRASSRPASWQISRFKNERTEVFPGDYATAEDALSAFNGVDVYGEKDLS
jgi:hypothetical protein